MMYHFNDGSVDGKKKIIFEKMRKNVLEECLFDAMAGRPLPLLQHFEAEVAVVFALK